MNHREPDLEPNENLSPEAWMVLNALEHGWVQAMLANILNLREEEIVLAIKEINHELGRSRV